MFLKVKLMLIASCFVSALGKAGKRTRPNPDRDIFDSPVDKSSNSPDESRGRGAIPVPDLDVCPADEGGSPPRALRALQGSGWKWREYCSIGQPGDVVNFSVVCEGASYLDFQIADCCIDGDHWQLKGKAWDVAPQTAVTTSPGGDRRYGVPARVYNYGGTQNAPKRLDALIECSYLHGVSVFGAGSYVAFRSDADDCRVIKTPVSSRIDRSP